MNTNTLIIGAGPAGLSCAIHLAEQGGMVTLLDHRAPWEKPCGGLLSPGVIEHYPWILPSDGLIAAFTRMTFISSRGEETTVALPDAILSASRYEISRIMSQRASRLGITVIQERVHEIRMSGNEYTAITPGGEYTENVLVGADGVFGKTRRQVSLSFEHQNLMTGYGYHLAGTGEDRCLFAFGDFTGYVWLIPHKTHVNAGIVVRKGEKTGTEIRALLDTFLQQHYPRYQILHTYSALLPAPVSPGFFNIPACGDNWLLTGDAAGHVDPVTGEGIYYALESGRLAAEAILAGDVPSYDKRWQAAYGEQLRQKAAFMQSLEKLSTDFGPEMAGAMLYKYMVDSLRSDS